MSWDLIVEASFFILDCGVFCIVMMRCAFVFGCFKPHLLFNSRNKVYPFVIDYLKKITNLYTYFIIHRTVGHIR